MRFERLKNFAILGALFAFVLVFLAANGCAGMHAADATPAQIRQEERLAQSTEAHAAHAAADDLVVTLHRTHALTDAQTVQAAGHLLAARKSIDAADALLIDGSPTAFAKNLTAAWTAMDQASAITGRKLPARK